MLTNRYLSSAKNLPAIFAKIQEGMPPTNFNTEHLASIGFSSSNDRAVVPLLKELGFLNPDGTPTQRYKDYRDTTRSRAVLGEAVRDIYSDLFIINEKLTDRDRDAIEGRFKSTHSSSDRVAELQAATFLSLLKMCDINHAEQPVAKPQTNKPEVMPTEAQHPTAKAKKIVDLNYRIEIHLPATKDIDVYNAIFRSIKENLLDD